MIHRLRLSSLLCTCLGAAALAACGGGHDVDPRVIAGGGIADPGIDGEVNVHVIDADTDAPIEGATVHVGGVEGTTDASGLFVANDVEGRQTITVIASGYVTATWVGVNGANVTIPLDPPDDTTPTTIPQGTVSGTIEGWDALQAPAGRALIALAGYSATHDLDDPANDIPQPSGNPPPNMCLKLPAGPSQPCAWTLNTRTGQMAIFALIGNVDQAQNIEITDFAYATGVAVDDGEDVTGVSLEVAGAANLVDAGLTLASAPEGTDTVQSLVLMNLGDDGRLLLPQSADLTVPVPSTALFAGSSYEVIAIAESEAADDAVQSIVWQRGLDSVESVTVGSFLPLPAGLETDGATFSFEAVAEGSLHLFGVSDADDGTGRWAVAIFDGSTSVALPEHVELPAGALSYEVQALEIPDLDVEDFSIDAIEDTVTRSSADGVEFTN